MMNAPAGTQATIAVLVHVHYPDIWRDMSEVLADRLRLPFHLVVTTSHPRDEIVLPRTQAMLSARVLPVENRGRDILPFLHALTRTDGFDLGLKLHTKKSPQRADGAHWRAAILDSLLPFGSGADTIVARMRADPRIGLVLPAGFCLSVRPWTLQNVPAMRQVMEALGAGLSDSDLDDVFFAAGSMFWFRRTALAGLTDPKLPDLFEPEEGQFDGTIAHAMERLFPIEARRQGYVSLAMPALMASRPDMASAELLDLTRRHADVPSRYFPAPGVHELPLEPAPGAPLNVTRLLAAAYRHSVPIGLRRGVRRWLRR
jgi:lipopolysaccharide biosynthesis protein